jgi:FixJ family two-component response regulator
MNQKNTIIFIIDDDPSMRDALSYLLLAAGYEFEAFASAEAFLERPRFEGVGCLVLDVRMPGMTGLDLQRELADVHCPMPVIFITAHGDIPMSVEAMKRGAIDFLPKPFDDEQLLGAIEAAIERYRQARPVCDETQAIQERIKKLTPREYEVFRYVITGMLNKQIAAELNIAEHTVKIHRGRVMEKLAAHSVPDLVRLAQKTAISAV